MRKKILILLLILLLTFFLRSVNISNNPKALYGDELSLALDSYSILNTGKDQTGEFLPITFHQGGGRSGGYVYGSIPFVALFGPTPLGIRLLSVLSGLGIVVMVFLIAGLVAEEIGVISAALLAISPWDISLSRGGFESHFALFLSLVGVYGLFKAKVNPKWYLLSGVGFFLSIFTYPTYRLIIPIFIIFFFWVFREHYLTTLKKNVNPFLGAFLIFLILSLALSYNQTFGKESDERFSSINVFSQAELKNNLTQKINLERNLDSLPKSLALLFHNKYLEYVEILGENYLKNLSPNFLFLHGDTNPRHNPTVMGEFYLVDLILIIFGAIYLFKKNKTFFKVFSGWILIAPLSASLVGDPHALRSSFMLPPLIIFSSLGLYFLFFKRKKRNYRVLILGLVLIFILQFGVFLDRLYFLSGKQFSFFWDYPAKEASLIAFKNKDKYQYILLSTKINSLELAYPVYATVNPDLVISRYRKRAILGNYYFKKFDNIFLGEVADQELTKFLNNLSGSVLYVGSPQEALYLKNFQVVKGPGGNNDLITYVK